MGINILYIQLNIYPKIYKYFFYLTIRREHNIFVIG